MVKLLLKNGANIDDKNNDGSTPLHLACGNRSLEVVKLFLGNGTDE